MTLPDNFAVDQLWECPKCGTQMGMGPPAKMTPPWCGSGHDRTEMEQIKPERFGQQHGDSHDV